MVAGGHLTEPSNDVAYCSIALLKTIRAVLFIGLLNGLVMCACDIGSAYLEAYTREKLYIVAGPEFKLHTLLEIFWELLMVSNSVCYPLAKN